MYNTNRKERKWYSQKSPALCTKLGIRGESGQYTRADDLRLSENRK